MMPTADDVAIAIVALGAVIGIVGIWFSVFIAPSRGFAHVFLGVFLILAGWLIVVFHDVLFAENVSAAPGIDASAARYSRAEYVRVLPIIVPELKLRDVQRHHSNNISAQLSPRRLLLVDATENQSERNDGKQDGRQRRNKGVVFVGKPLSASDITPDDDDGIYLVVGLLGGLLAGILIYAGLKGR